MEQIPDAPWIRQAENFGVPSEEPVRCPICGAETDIIYTDQMGDAVGCEWCIAAEDAYEWRAEHAEY